MQTARPPVNTIVYLSRATMHVDRAELVDITNISAVNNRRRDVTGALLFCDGYFLQILEGPAAALDALVEKIAGDERHADLQVIERRANVERTFGDWDMACLHEVTMTPEQAERIAACVALVERPELVDRIGNDAHHLLLDLRDAIAAEAIRDAA